jgi:hypothetical protein
VFFAADKFHCRSYPCAVDYEALDNVAPFDPTVQYLVAHPNERIVHEGLVTAEREKDK